MVDIYGADFSEVLDLNLESKSKFYELMGETGRTIIPVELEQDAEALDHLVAKFTRSLGFTLYNEINNGFSFEEIVENKLNSNKYLEKYDLTLGAGMKFSKALMKIMEKMKYAHAQRDRVISDYSLVLNEKKLKGALVLSVNPIDFLTMSWSDTWSSCLSAGGEYESGTLGYAVDETTVLAFFISSKDTDELLANRYVNKKWRKILIVSQEGEEAILTSRGYPYNSPMLSDAAVQELSALLFESSMVKYDYEKVYTRIKTVMGSGAPGYSDIGLRNQIYVYSTIEDLDSEKYKDSQDKIVFKFSQRYRCVHCLGNDADAESFACIDCGGYDVCEDCDDAIPREGGYYTAYGYMVCECCMENDYAFAENDDELYRMEDLTYINSSDSFVTDRYARANCDECKSCKETFETDDLVDTEKGVFCDDCVGEATAEEEII